MCSDSEQDTLHSKLVPRDAALEPLVWTRGHCSYTVLIVYCRSSLTWLVVSLRMRLLINEHIWGQEPIPFGDRGWIMKSDVEERRFDLRPRYKLCQVRIILVSNVERC